MCCTWGPHLGLLRISVQKISVHRLMTTLAVGPIGFEKMAVSLLENWWAEMSVNLQKSQLIWGTPCTSDKTEFEEYYRRF